MNTTHKITVKQQKEIGSKNWGVYLNGELVEGGFFDKYNADDAAINWAAQLMAEDYIKRKNLNSKN